MGKSKLPQFLLLTAIAASFTLFMIHNHSYKVERRNFDLSDEVTIVTSYVDIGTFAKGGGGVKFTQKMYKNWLKIFAKLKNPVIGYFVDDDTEHYFRQIRATQPKERTETVKFVMNSSWAFSLKPRIKRIISAKSYPRHQPNTVIPEYGCVMHAKYEMVANVARQNPFNTKYIAWLDIGYFRDLCGQNIHNTSDFTL